MKAEFEKAFLKGVRKHSSIKKQIEQKVRQIIEHPVELGEPLKGKLRGFYSCAVKRNFIIIYLYCSNCSTTSDETIKFVLLGPHDEVYGGRD